MPSPADLTALHIYPRLSLLLLSAITNKQESRNSSQRELKQANLTEDQQTCRAPPERDKKNVPGHPVQRQPAVATARRRGAGEAPGGSGAGGCEREAAERRGGGAAGGGGVPRARGGPARVLPQSRREAPAAGARRQPRRARGRRRGGPRGGPRRRRRAPGGVRRWKAPRRPRPPHGRAHLRRPRAHTQGRRRALALSDETCLVDRLNSCFQIRRSIASHYRPALPHSLLLVLLVCVELINYSGAVIS
jgi:hypothetical protein